MTNSPLSYRRSGNLRSLKPYIKTLSRRKIFETFSLRWIKEWGTANLEGGGLF